MRSAPPVLVPVGRFVWVGRLAVLLALFSGAWLGLAWLVSGATAVQGAWWLGIWLVAGLIAFKQAFRDALPSGVLDWDGETWAFAVADGMAVPARVHVLWDVGSAMLIGVMVSQGPWRGQRFAWLSAASFPQQWHGWRCAVHAGSDIL